MIQTVLGTDMANHKKHFATIESLKEKMANQDKVLDEVDKVLLLGVVIHTADIGNACKPKKLCIDWAERVVDEFRQQGDEEKRRFDAVSDKLFSREHPLAQGQFDWIKFVMVPYMKEVKELVGNAI